MSGKKIHWTFDAGKREVAFDDGGEVFRWREPTYGELLAFRATLERAANLYVRLARERIERPDADKPRDDEPPESVRLLDLAGEAARRLAVACGSVGRFFDSRGAVLDRIFAAATDDFIAFCREWIALHGPDESFRLNLVEGAVRETAPGAPRDCFECQSFVLDGEGNPIRARKAESEFITDENCAACPWIKTTPRTFAWRQDTRAVWEEYKLVQRRGDAARSLSLFELLCFDVIDAALDGGARRALAENAEPERNEAPASEVDWDIRD